MDEQELKQKQKQEQQQAENILHIYKYGDDVLRLKAPEIENINDRIVKLRQNMIETMYDSPSAVGLAAPQVGESLRMSVIDITRGEEEDSLLVLINPEILEIEGSDVDTEGCLSFPFISVPVKRAERIFLKNYDLDGNEIKLEINGFLARVVQHEIDHLDGTMIIDRVSPLKRQFLKKEIRRLKREGDWE